MNPKLRALLALALALNTTDDVFRSPLLASGEGEGGGEGGGGEKGGKTFTQEEVNSLIAKTRRELEQKATESQKAHEAKLAEITAKLEAFESEKKLEGVTGKDREIERLKQSIAKLEADAKAAADARAKAEGDAKAIGDKFRTHRASEVVRDALLKAGALTDPKAIALATRTMMQDGSIDIAEDEKGNLSIAHVFDGKRFDAVQDAAKTWLEQNALFSKAAGGGGGTKAPNGSGTGGAKQLADASFEQLAAAVVAEKS